MSESEERAVEALRKIKVFADSAVLGDAQLTEDYVMDTHNHIHCWRTYMGIIWALTYEGLGLDLPKPPAWPPEPLKKPPCPRGMSGPCEDCLYFPGNLDNKGGVTNARSL